jgi:predicted metal-binding transcription factor (methanogenesis marker protein 9)
MEYASGGNLHSYLKKNFTSIKWITKLAILCQISDGYLYFITISINNYAN